MMKSYAACLTISIFVFSSAALAQEELPSTALMGEQAEHMYGGLNSMVKGEQPFDAAKADRLIAALISTARRIPSTFTENLKGRSSPKSRYSASSKVWENKADFDAHATKLVQSLEENRSKVSTLDGLKAAYSAINSECTSCHSAYRVRKN
jgi:cytochrome c556